MKYEYHLVEVEFLDGKPCYTYNVYKKWFCFYKSIYSFMCLTAEDGIKACEDFIKSRLHKK